MKKCPVCGKEWSDATRFCGSCGAKLEDGNIVVPDIVPDDGKEEQRKKTEPVKPSVKKTIEPVRPKTRETAENKKIAEEKEEEKNTAERKRAEYNKSDAVLPVKRRKKRMENCDSTWPDCNSGSRSSSFLCEVRGKHGTPICRIIWGQL